MLCEMTLRSAVGLYQSSAKHSFHFRVDDVAWYPYILLVSTMVLEHTISTLVCVYVKYWFSPTRLHGVKAQLSYYQTTPL